MSDRVRFVTVNDTVVPADSSAFNGFPAPFIATGGIFFPSAVPLTDIATWFWRRRKWSLASDATVTVDTFTGGLMQGDMAGGPGPTDVSGSARGRELAAVASSVNGPAVSVGSNADGDALGAASLTLFLDGVSRAPVIHFDGISYYPAMGIAGTLTVDDGAGNSITLTFSSDSGAIGGTPDGTITGTVDGFDIPIHYRTTITGAGGTFTFTTFDVSPTTSSDSYWAYAAADTSPIYDTSTGAQLQSPLN